jgi:hypothetical protein
MTAVGWRVTAAALTMLIAVDASACSNAANKTIDLGGSDTSSPDGGTGSVQEWIAVFRIEADPHNMSEDTADVLAVVGGAIVVSPVACFEGLPSDDPLDAYLLGVAAPSKEALDEILADVDRTVIFEGRVRTMCLD